MVPEVGVNITEGAKQKSGGKDFTTVFGKPSKYDYLALSKQNAQNNLNSTGLKKGTPSLMQSSEFPDKSLNYSQTNLPFLSSGKSESRNITNPLYNSHTLNHSVDVMRINYRLSGTLKSNLDILDLIPEYDENDYSNNNIDIFKKRKTYLQEQKEQEKRKLTNDLEDIDKFNIKIIKNNQWGNISQEKSKNFNLFKKPSKPDRKELEKELGKKIVSIKMPRSRILSNSVTKI